VSVAAGSRWVIYGCLLYCPGGAGGSQGCVDLMSNASELYVNDSSAGHTAARSVPWKYFLDRYKQLFKWAFLRLKPTRATFICCQICFLFSLVRNFILVCHKKERKSK
jgi:hypothetical protein